MVDDVCYVEMCEFFRFVGEGFVLRIKKHDVFKRVDFLDNNFLDTLPFVPEVLNQETGKNTEDKTDGRKEPANATQILVG